MQLVSYAHGKSEYEKSEIYITANIAKYQSIVNQMPKRITLITGLLGSQRWEAGLKRNPKDSSKDCKFKSRKHIIHKPFKFFHGNINHVLWT